MSERIRAIISSAEAAANAVRHEAEQRAQVKRRLADEEAQRIVDDARRDAQAFLAERIRRISELSDAVVERGEGIVMRLDRAEEVRRQLQGLADALGESAEELARDLGAEPPAGSGPIAEPKPRPAPLRPPTEPGPLAERRTTPESQEPATRRFAESAAPADSRESTPSIEALDAEIARAEAASAAESASAAEPASPEVEAEIADDPTIGELAGEASAEATGTTSEDDDDAPVVPVELVPDEPQDEPERPGAREPDDQLSARLVALQMAVAGGKRDEVEAHLRRTFKLDDVGGILDDVFGDGNGGDTAGWPTSRGGAA